MAHEIALGSKLNSRGSLKAALLLLRIPQNWITEWGLAAKWVNRWWHTHTTEYTQQWESEREVVSDSATPWTAAHQASPSMGFSRQEYWSGVPLPGKSHRRWNLVGYSPWGRKESYTTEQLHFPFLQGIFPTQGSNPGLLHWRQML